MASRRVRHRDPGRLDPRRHGGQGDDRRRGAPGRADCCHRAPDRGARYHRDRCDRDGGGTGIHRHPFARRRLAQPGSSRGIVCATGDHDHRGRGRRQLAERPGRVLPVDRRTRPGGERRVDVRARNGAWRRGRQRQSAGHRGGDRRDAIPRRRGARGRCLRRIDRAGVHARGLRVGGRVGHGECAARGAWSSLRHAHAQRGRPGARGDRRGDRDRPWGRMPAADFPSQDAGAPQLVEARPGLREDRGRGAGRDVGHLRPLPLHRLLDRAHRALPDRRAGERHRRPAPADRRSGHRRGGSRCGARQGGADRGLGRCAGDQRARGGRPRRGGAAARQLRPVARPGSLSASPSS